MTPAFHCRSRASRPERRPARLLDSLGALGGWLVAPDPGLNRLRTVLCTTLTIAGAIGAEWLFVHFTGTLQRPAPPAAAGAAAAARVAAANHGVLIFAIVLAGVIGLSAAIAVQDTSRGLRTIARESRAKDDLAKAVGTASLAVREQVSYCLGGGGVWPFRRRA
jgi:hypothetical protein